MRTLLVLLLTLVLPSGLSGQYVTRLKGEPVPDISSFWPFQLEPATAEHLAGLPSQPGDRAFAGILEVLEGSDLDARLVLVEPAEGEPFLYVDADLDGILSSGEKFAFGEVPGVEGPASLFRFHVNTTGLPYYPVVLSPAPVGKDGSRGLLRTDSFYLRGTVEVAGQEVMVRYPVYPFTGRVELKKGVLGMDLDGDGEIATGLSAGETDRDKGQGVVFPLAGMAFSTTRVDAAAGLAELRIHPASDIKGFDLRPGSTVPDFAYTDVDGQPRRLSELRGKLVLLDFWGTWCIPCRQELPDLRKAFAAYRDRGFVILGMDARDELARLQAFVAEQDVPWLHATADSVEDVIKHGFRVRGYPTKILLDREGRVISAGDPGQPPLTGEALLTTIVENLPTPAKEYGGQLQGEPIADAHTGNNFFLDPAPPELLAALPWPPAAEDRISVGSFRVLREDKKEVKVVLVEPAGGEPYVYVDHDLDGKLRAWERFAFGRLPEVEEPAVLLKFPLGKAGLVPFYPVLLRPYTGSSLEDGRRRLVRTTAAYMEGKAQIGMLPVLVRYPISPKTGEVTLEGRMGMDLDDNGVIEPGYSSPEMDHDFGEGAPVFRLEDTYLSTSSLDPVTGRIVLRTRPASDYKRFDLSPGVELADFAFTDPDGRKHRLSELRGKVVLLDFWGTWCGWCLMEAPTLRKAYESFRDRGFVILGMDYGEDLETLKTFLADADMPWIHATAESVEGIIEKNFRVSSFPTHILLDRDGRIVSAGRPGEPPLKDEDLLKTVEEVVSRKPVVEYVGQLGEPVPHIGFGYPEKLDPAPPELLEALPVRPAPEARVYSGKMRVLRRSKLDAQLALVEPPRGKPFLYADLDLDGKLSTAERLDFGDWPGLKKGWGAALLRFPMGTGRLQSYPILLSWNPEESAQPKDQPRSLVHGTVAYFEGTVPVEGREVKVRYPLSREALAVSLREGEIGMDLDGDGRFSSALSTAESQFPVESGKPLIFRLGDLYLSTKSVDAATGRVVLRTHAPSEYRRFDLNPGSQIPDFGFTDLEGRQRRLSELRGKVVLLDVWGAWCPGCVEELPLLQQAYDAYRDRGLEILSLDYDDKPEEFRKLVAEKKLSWIHATAFSVEDVVRHNFRIWTFPTKILLDREGRIVSVGDPGQPRLDEEHLLKTLEKVLSGSYASPTSSR